MAAALLCSKQTSGSMSAKNNLPNNVRILKVYDKIFGRGGQRAHRRYSVLFPEIRLIGRWLQDYGFKPGQYIEVKQEHGKLTITPAWFEDEEY